MTPNNPEEPGFPFQGRRMESNNPLVSFILDHAGCLKYFCTTCGGMWAFQRKLGEFLISPGIDLASLLEVITLSDIQLLASRDRLEFLKAVFIKKRKFMEPQMAAIAKTWRQMLGKYVEFDEIIFKNLEEWNQDIPFNDIWFRPLFHRVIGQSSLNLASQMLGYLSREAGKNLQLARQETAYREILNDIKTYRAKAQAEEQAAQQLKKELEQKRQQEIAGIVEKLSGLGPVERLKHLLAETDLPVKLFPESWAEYHPADWQAFDTHQLTQFLHELKPRVSHRDRSSWRKLVACLYQQRQKMLSAQYHREKQNG